MRTQCRKLWRSLSSTALRHESDIARRRILVTAAGLIAAAAARPVHAGRPIYLGLTPVFLDSDIKLLAALTQYLTDRLEQPVSLVKRRTYQEITAMLLSEQLDAAWICGFPLVQHPDDLVPIAVPVWQGRPLYRSYIIAAVDDPVSSFAHMRGYVHAFSDPDSNSGFLVTRHLLTTMQERPDTFFSRHFFTYGHRNVVRAVASGLAQCGSVDGYVWEVVRDMEPELTSRTRVVRKSELLGFPPVAANIRLRDTPTVRKIADALNTMSENDAGRALLDTLRLDGFTPGGIELFAGIARKYREVMAQA